MNLTMMRLNDRIVTNLNSTFKLSSFVCIVSYDKNKSMFLTERDPGGTKTILIVASAIIKFKEGDKNSCFCFHNNLTPTGIKFETKGHYISA